MSDSQTSTTDVLAVDAAVLGSTASAAFGVTADGFVPKPFARLLAEKLALARALFGDALDLGSGSAVRKLLEVSALEDARQWAALAACYDNAFVVSAKGEALSRLGEELGLPRPFLEARGLITLKLIADFPPGTTQITLPRGARLSTPGGHHVAVDEGVTLSKDSPERTARVVAFYPGASHNLDPAVPSQKIDRWNFLDAALIPLDTLQKAAGEELVGIEHREPLTGGERQWPDARYRELLLRAPRSLWSVESIRIAVSLVPGVRQVQVRDGLGGLDINQSIFGNFSFIERVFGSERDLGSPYYFTVLVASTENAIWEGPDGLFTSVSSAIEDLRPIGLFPRIERASLVGVGVRGKLVVTGLPLPAGPPAVVNASAAAGELKARLLQRLQTYVNALEFGEPVRAAEVTWAIMNEPGVSDLLELQLKRYPPNFESVDLKDAATLAATQALNPGDNLALAANEIAVLVDDASELSIV